MSLIGEPHLEDTIKKNGEGRFFRFSISILISISVSFFIFYFLFFIEINLGFYHGLQENIEALSLDRLWDRCPQVDSGVAFGMKAVGAIVLD